MLVWSYGGGTQSAAIAALIKTGELPMPDLIVMADTGREVSETWEYLEKVIRPAGFDVQVIPHSYSYLDIVKSGSNDILIPAYTRRSGRVGKLPTFCSYEWKRRPIMRWLKEHGVNDCDVWLGISIDEAERMRQSDVKWFRHVYPLIELRPTTRAQCMAIVEKMGWAKPPKTRCWMCPNMSKVEWRDLKTRYPEDFNKAVKLEEELHAIDPDIYLHSLAVPLNEALEIQSTQPDLFDSCDSGFCFV